MTAGRELALALVVSMRDEASAQLKKLDQSLSETGAGLARLGGLAMAGLGALTTALFVAGKAAADEQVGINQLGQTLDNFQQNTAAVREEIEKYLVVERDRVGLDDGEGRASLDRLTQVTKDYHQALTLLPLALDMAQARGLDLVTATDLVGKVAAGNVSILTRYGIVLKDGATATEALAELQRRFGGQAETAASGWNGLTKKLKAYGDEIKETVGGIALPYMEALGTRAVAIAKDALAWVEAHRETVKTIIAVMGGLLTAVVALLGPLTLVAGALKAIEVLRVPSMLQGIAGGFRAIATGASSAVTAMGGIGTTVAILGPLAIALALVGLKVSQNISAQQELATQARITADAHMARYEEIAAMYKDRAKDITDLGTKLETARAEYGLLAKAQLAIEASGNQQNATIFEYVNTADTWVGRLLANLHIVPKSAEMAANDLKRLQEQWEKLQESVKAEAMSKGLAAFRATAESGKSFLDEAAFSWQQLANRVTAENDRLTALGIDWAANLQSAAKDQAATLRQMEADWRSLAQSVGEGLGGGLAKAIAIQADAAAQMRAIDIAFLADFRKQETELQRDRVLLIAQGNAEALALRKEGKNAEAKQRLIELNQEVAEFDEHAQFMQDHQAWAADVETLQANLARAEQLRELKGDLLAELIIRTTSDKDIVTAMSIGMGLQNNAKITGYILQLQSTDLYNRAVKEAMIIGITDQVEIAKYAGYSVALAFSQGMAGISGSADLDKLAADTKARLEALKLSEPIEDMKKKLADLLAGGLGSGIGAPTDKAVGALSNAAANSASTATQNIRIIIKEAKEALANLVGFEMPAGVDHYLSQVADFLGKAMETFDGLYRRIDAPARRLKSLFPIITDLGQAMKALNEAMHSFVPDLTLPDWSKWREQVREWIREAVAAIEDAEATYGRSRLAKAGEVAANLRDIMSMTSMGAGPTRMAGAGASAGGGGGYTFNITINAPGGDPGVIERAVVKGARSVLQEARAVGL